MPLFSHGRKNKQGHVPRPKADNTGFSFKLKTGPSGSTWAIGQSKKSQSMHSKLFKISHWEFLKELSFLNWLIRLLIDFAVPLTVMTVSSFSVYSAHSVVNYLCESLWDDCDMIYGIFSDCSPGND